MVLGELYDSAEGGLDRFPPRTNDLSGIGAGRMMCGAPDVARQVEDGADRLPMARFHVNGVPMYMHADSPSHRSALPTMLFHVDHLR